MTQDFLQLIRERHSTRAFLPQPVERALVEKILNTARFAPSSTNMQPWEVLVLQGAAKTRLDQLLLGLFDAGEPGNPQLHAYLDEWVEPYKSRRFACGTGLYKTLGIDRSDKAARQAQSRRNFDAFGAPTALIFYQDGFLKPGSILDLGMFLQNVMLAAQALGLATCAEASLVAWPDQLKQAFALAPGKRLLTGLALGWPDPAAPVNTFRTARAEVHEFARFLE